MALSLTSEEQRRFTTAARTLLSPLAHPTLEEWRQEVLIQVTELLGADSGGFMLPMAGHPPFSLRNLPSRFGREFMEDEAQRALAARMAREGEPRVWSTRLLAARMGLEMPEGWFATPEYRTFYARYELQEAIGFITSLEAVRRPAARRGAGPAAGGGRTGDLPAMLTCFRRTYGSEVFGDRGLALMRMLRPAAEAGVMTVVRHAGALATLEAVLGGARTGARLVDAHGRELYRNPALERMLSEDPEREAVTNALGRAAARLAPLVGGGPDGDGPRRLSEAVGRIRTGVGGYRIWATLLSDAPLADGPATLVQVERTEPSLPSLRELEERWGLTRQQARVARFLARGRSNREVARSLRIRPSTARRYTEAVFRKLDVHARGEVALRLLEG
jgi:DNA-binding CsgD family transcriptional regulator